jgi:hypothetical protein
VARPIELTPEIVEGIANLVRAGNIPLRAAIAKGVPRSTWYSWLARGRAGAGRRHEGLEVPETENVFIELVEAVERAESESQIILVNSGTNALPPNPRGALAMRARRWPREWSRTERHELSGPEGGPVQVEDYRARLSERADSLAARLLAPLGPGDPGGESPVEPAP